MNQLQTTINRMACVTFITLLCFSSHSQSNYAVSFDGVDDYISVPHNASLNVSNFSFEAWINLSSTSGTLTILSKGDGTNASTTNYIFNVGGSSNDGKLGLFAGGAWYSANTILSTGVWYHAAVTVSGTAVTFYLNGMSDGTATLSGAMYTGGTYLFKIGEQGDGCNCNHLNGTIDEVRIWNTAITQADIKTNMYNKNLSNSASGLIAYYRLNEGSGITIANSCTNTSGIDGTLTNGPAWTPSPIQFGGNALKFNGTSNYVELSNRINVGSSDFTIEAWVYPQSTSIGMVYAQDVCGDGEQQFRFHTNNSKVNFDMSDAAALGTPYNFQLPSTANSVPLNTWTHIAVTRSGNNYTLYINGVSNTTYSTGTNTINNQSGADVNKRLRIGARGGVSGGCGLNYFNGSIDEIRLWNVARTATDIGQNYTKEIDPTTNASLVAYYTFDQGIAGGTNTGITTLIDQAGNNNGTLTNFSLSGATGNFVTQNSGMSVLPLKWLSFTAEKQKEGVLLQWKTASETNTSDFMIERSIDGKQWKSIGTVPASNSYRTNSYHYTDAAPSAGMNYYRIRQNDLDGRYSYSAIRSVRMENAARSFEVLSNPVISKLLQLQINGAGEQTLTLYYCDGRLVWTKEFSPGMHSINTTGLSGIYLLKSDQQTEKLVIQ